MADTSPWFPVLETNQGTLTLLALVFALGIALWEHHRWLLSNEDSEASGLEDSLNRLLGVISHLGGDTEIELIKGIAQNDVEDLRAVLASGRQKYHFASSIRLAVSMLSGLVAATEKPITPEDRAKWREILIGVARGHMARLGARISRRHRATWDMMTSKAPLIKRAQ